jgi:hypothetical protein
VSTGGELIAREQRHARATPQVSLRTRYQDFRKINDVLRHYGCRVSFRSPHMPRTHARTRKMMINWMRQVPNMPSGRPFLRLEENFVRNRERDLEQWLVKLKEYVAAHVISPSLSINANIFIYSISN